MVWHTISTVLKILQFEFSIQTGTKFDAIKSITKFFDMNIQHVLSYIQTTLVFETLLNIIMNTVLAKNTVIFIITSVTNKNDFGLLGSSTNEQKGVKILLNQVFLCIVGCLSAAIVFLLNSNIDNIIYF